MRSFHKSDWLYVIYSAFSELLILGPIIVIFMLAKGLSFTEIMILQSVSAIAVVFFDVPTGAFADKYKRKYSMFLGSICWILALLLYIYGNGFLVFVIAEIMFGVGTAFKSGSNNALIYEILKKQGRENEYQKIEGKAQSLIYFSQAIGSIIAGFAYSLNIYIPLIISIFFMVIAAILSLMFNEPEITASNFNNRKSMVYLIKDSWDFVHNNQKLKAIIFFGMGSFVFLRSAFWFFQPYMDTVEIPVEWFGIVLFILNMVSALMANRVDIFVNITKKYTFTTISAMMIVSFILLSFNNKVFGLLGMIINQAVRGLYYPIITKYINNYSVSDKRATIISFNSFVCNFIYALSIPVMGFIKDITNIFTIHRILALATTIVAVITLYYMKKQINSALSLDKDKIYSEEEESKEKLAG